MSISKEVMPLHNAISLLNTYIRSKHISYTVRWTIHSDDTLQPPEMVPGFQAHILQALRSTLVLPELDEKDSGNYSCVASNEIDTAILNQTYELTVSRGKVLPEHKVQVSNLTDLSILYSLPKLLR